MFLLFILAKIHKIQKTTFLRCKSTTLGNMEVIFANSRFFPPSRWQVWNLPRGRRWSCAATSLPLRAGDSVWPVTPSVPVSAVTSASSVALRQRSLAKRNGARRRTEEGEKTGGGENSAVAGSVPAAARLFPFSFPSALHHSARRSSVERNFLRTRARGYAKWNPLHTRAYYGWPCTTPR